MPDVRPHTHKLMASERSHAHIYCSVYAAIVFPVWWAACIADFRSDLVTNYALWVVPVFIPALFMAFNLMAFSWSYSAFGPLRRTAEPTAEPLEVASATSGQVGLLTATAPFFSWRLYSDGIAFTSRGVDTGFVPLSLVTRTKPRLFGGYSVWHSSPEIRSPLGLPSSAVADRLLQHRRTDLCPPS
jgi:hypothetical protein